MLDADGAVV